MKLVSVNTAMPMVMEYQGKVVITSILKKPITGCVYVGKSNLAGDQQADLHNHGGEHKAVYAFSADNYDYWRDTLQNSALAYGELGENLTIAGLDEDKLCIGDQLQIRTCLLEVAQPRVPCSKLGLVTENVKFPKLFLQSHKVGVYLRVLNEGEVEAGDDVIITKQSVPKVSVKSLFRAYFDKQYPNAEVIIEKALLIPELAPEWKKMLRSRLYD